MKTFLEWVQEIEENNWVSVTGDNNFNQTYISLISNMKNKDGPINTEANKKKFAANLMLATKNKNIDQKKLEMAARAYLEIFGVGFFNVANKEKSGQPSQGDFDTVLQQGAKRAENPIFRRR